MMDITLNIKITGLECLADGMVALANAWDAANRAIDPGIKRTTKMTVSETAANQGAPVQQTAQQAFTPVQQAAAPVTPAQQAVQQPVPAPVQTSAPTYTLDDLCLAAGPLMDAGRQQELMDLVARFGIVSLPELPPERFGEFATALRAMGAQI